MQVMAKRFPFVKRTAVLLDSCRTAVNDDDRKRLDSHGIKVLRFHD